jgi:hypothetical protein
MIVEAIQTQRIEKRTIVLYSCKKDFGRRSPNKFIKTLKEKQEGDVVKYFRRISKLIPLMKDFEVIEAIQNQPKLKVNIYKTQLHDSKNF